MNLEVKGFKYRTFGLRKEWLVRSEVMSLSSIKVVEYFLSLLRCLGLI